MLRIYNSLCIWVEMRFSGNLISFPSDVLQFGLHIKLDLYTIGIVFIIDAVSLVHATNAISL